MQSFNLKIDGDNVSPQTVDLGDLLDTLHNVRIAIIAAAVDEGQPRGSVFLSLQRIEKKCNLLTIGENEEARVGRIRVARAIRKRDMSLVPPESQEAIRKLWRKAAKQSWTIAFQDSEPEAIIDPAKGVPTEKYLRGKTSLFVYVLRAGGEDPTVQVKLATGQKVTFEVANSEIAVQLGERLYQYVVLKGDAKWLRGTQRIVQFKVTSIGHYNSRKASIKDTMAELSQIMGHHWKGVDADAYLREERSDD